MLQQLPAAAIIQTKPLFEMGTLVMTRGVNDAVLADDRFAEFLVESLNRHSQGDWGDMSKEDKEENKFSLNNDLRIFSSYSLKDKEYAENLPDDKLWIITEADRSVTTLLFPSEY